MTNAKMRILLNMQNGKCQNACLAKYAKWQMPNCIFNEICKLTHAKLHILLNMQNDKCQIAYLSKQAK